MRRRAETKNELWCGACQSVHPKAAFGRDKNSPSGFTYSCKKVTSERNRSYHKRHKARLNKKHKENRERRKKSPERIEWAVKKLVQDACTRAKKRNIEFSLTVNDLYAPKKCPIFGWPLIYQASKKRVDQSASLDRIDSSKGYMANNVWIISWRANQIKSDATINELRMIADALEAILKSSKKEAGHLLDGRELPPVSEVTK